MKKELKPYEMLIKIRKMIPEEVDNIDKVLKVFRNEKNQLIINKFIEIFNFNNYSIDILETLILSIIFDEYADGRGLNITAIDIIKEITNDKVEILELLEKFKTLINNNILFIQDHIEEFRLKNQKIKSQDIIENNCTTNSILIDWLFSEEYEIMKDLDKPYESNDEFISDWFNYIQKQKEVYIGNRKSFIIDDLQLTKSETITLIEADKIKEKIDNKLKITKKKIPFRNIADRYKLNKIEQKIVMYLIRENINDSNDIDTGDLLRLISTSKKELYKYRKYIDNESKLIKKKIMYNTERAVFSQFNEFTISKDILDEILELKPSSENDKLTDILKNSEIFTLIEPNQTFDDIILSDEVKNILKTGLSYYDRGVNRTIEEWGLFNKGTKEVGKNGKKNDMGLLMLFYGSPGTGKTFAAGALANKLGKKLLITDVSKIKSAWVGESEKNVQKMFDIFDEVVNTTTNPPIILMNEADQFLHKRMTEVNKAVDQMYNAVQNLFLEAFEKLKGILIATTNMHENLDPAFSRRFHLKIEFPLPDFEQRRQLWNLHITDSIPIANDINIDELAYNYKLSGGQIKVIVRNACVQAASREKTERILTQSYLVKYCELENSSELYQKERNIGFRSERNEN